ncbi:MAG: maleylpyruvate isomerase family mycothiol-dependent enzyme [Frankia sp.]
MTKSTAVHQLALVREHGNGILNAAQPDLTRPVPACPGWDLRRLVSHVAKILHQTIGHLPRGETTPPARLPPAPTSDTALLDYYAEGLAGALLILDAVDPDLPAWNAWSHTEQIAGFWRRRLAQEMTVHHWDAEQAWGRTLTIPPPVAADGVDEALHVFLPRTRRLASEAGTRLPDGSVHLHLVDTDGEWLVRFAGPDTEVTLGHEKGDAVLRGEAQAVLLTLWGRQDASGPGTETMGDPDLVWALRAER